MEAFLELKEQHVKYILDYIENHGYAAQGFYYGLKRNGDTWSIRKGATFFGYIREKALIGIVSFSTTKVMTCHFEDDSIYNKLDFLKVIRQYRPEVIKADRLDLERIRNVLVRVAICHDVEVCEVMHVNRESFKNDANVHGMIVDASLIPIRDCVPFLLQVEKAFGRNPLTVNQLKDKVDAIENYIYYIDKASNGGTSIEGQAVIEFEAENFAQLGGVYTNTSSRGKGIGKRLASVLTERMLEKGLDVNLLVMKNNESAIKVYRTLGYEVVHELGLMAVDTI